MPPRERFYTLPAQTIQGDGRVDAPTAVVLAHNDPAGSSVTLPNYLNSSTQQTDQTHQVQIWNRGTGRVRITVEGGTLNGQPFVEIGPGQVATATSIPTPAAVPEYGLIVADPPAPPTP